MKSWSEKDKTDWHEEGKAETIKEVVIEEGITSIGEYAFLNCENLTNIEISSTITAIGKPEISVSESQNNKESNVFLNCKKLSNIEVSTGNTNYSSVEGILFNKNQTEIEYYPEGKTQESYSIPGTVTKIGEGAFKNSSLTNIVMQEGLKI